MKKLVEQARTLGGTVVDAVRRAVDPPLDQDARPLDVKRAIVEAVEQQLEPAGGGRRVLPGDGVVVKLLAEQVEARRALEAVLADIRDTIAARLQELQCSVPRRFSVDVSYIRRLPVDWAPGQRLSVTLTQSAARGATDGDGEQGGLPTLAIEVLRGQTEQQQFTLIEPVVRIGRSSDPTDDRGRPRFNHIAFLENDSPENRTVTRGHALIRYNATTGEYRLFDEGSANGTRVVRHGEVVDVPKRDPVGLALRSGDEVQLGKAAIKVRIGS
jgi:pSer/pThr/pTyr-binding forkhead associated (FHA) protein